jgi:hypothetical protein
LPEDGCRHVCRSTSNVGLVSCRPPTSAHQAQTVTNIPTRLMKISSSVNTIENIRLFSISESKSAATTCLTLSHCWGGADIVKLKTGKVKEFHEQISLDLLPKTFSDAVRITVVVGYHYLWIDFICIIQNSDEDWLQEATMMGSVYRNSANTIAALGASRKLPQVCRRWCISQAAYILRTDRFIRYHPLGKSY